MVIKGSLFPVGRNVVWFNFHGKQYGNFSIEKQTNKQIASIWQWFHFLAFTPNTKTLIWKLRDTPRFTAMLLRTIPRIWQQPICPMTDEWIKKLWYFYIIDYSLARRWKFAICYTWIELEGIMFSKISHREEDKNWWSLTICSMEIKQRIHRIKL